MSHFQERPLNLIAMLHVALYAPRIPQNTGQIARACFATQCKVHLIRPLGFRVDAHALKRASVNYWDGVDWMVHESGEAFWNWVPDPARVWLVTKFGQQAYTKAAYQDGDVLLLGSETEGLPPEWLERYALQTIKIAMPNPQARCLNLATSACVVLFEALRQIG